MHFAPFNTLWQLFLPGRRIPHWAKELIMSLSGQAMAISVILLAGRTGLPNSSNTPSSLKGNLQNGGEGGIRTHGTVAGTPDFESGTFGHSATSPVRG